MGHFIRAECLSLYFVSYGASMVYSIDACDQICAYPTIYTFLPPKKILEHCRSEGSKVKKNSVIASYQGRSHF